MQKWRWRAACAGAPTPQRFDPPNFGGVLPLTYRVRYQKLKEQYCDPCSVRAECLADALKQGDQGLRGGVLLRSNGPGTKRIEAIAENVEEPTVVSHWHRPSHLGDPCHCHPCRDARRKRVRELSDAGVSVTDTAEILGMSRRNVSRYRKEEGAA